MPAALVPRPWDFPDPPRNLEPLTQAPQPLAKAPATEPVPTLPAQPAQPVSQPSSSEVAPVHPASPTPAAPDLAPTGP